jgi:hypothetical protein
MQTVFGNVRQLGFISRDLDRSMAWFIDCWGIGPWYTLRNVKSAMLHRGEPVDLEMSIALAHCGDMQFEIVVQHSEVPSLYTDALAQTASLHVQHVAVWHKDVNAIEAAAHARGWTTIFETKGGPGPGRSVFVSHPEQPLMCIEISDLDPFKEGVREKIRQAAAHWDGKEPIREGLPV